MVKRKIIEIDEEKCNGCGKCIVDCPEGALKLIDSKARIISDLYCDGLGACIGSCPEDAIKVIEREAELYDERKVMENIVKKGENTIKAHLEHLKDHNEEEYLKQAIKVLEEKGLENPLEGFVDDRMEEIPCGCPGSMVKDLRENESSKKESDMQSNNQTSELKQWPVQLNLLPPTAPFFENADLLIAADCVAFANPTFHSKLLKGKAIAIGCPKLDDIQEYKEKIKQIIENNDLNTITTAIMEVPCCYGMYSAVEEALEETGKRITLKSVVVGIDGSTR